MTRRRSVALAAIFSLAVGTAFGQGILPRDRDVADGNLSHERQSLDTTLRVPPSDLGILQTQTAAVRRAWFVDRRIRSCGDRLAQPNRGWSREQGEPARDSDLGLSVYVDGYRDQRALAARWTRPSNSTRLGFRIRPVKSEPGILMPRAASADEDLLKTIYGLGRPFDSVMIAAEASAWPVFIGAVPIAWVIAAVNRDRTDVRAALGIAMSEGVAAAASMGLKRLVGRPRPYTAVSSIVARSEPHRDGSARDPYSFPSGHAALSFSLATAVALESERWYVTIPVFVWASAVSVSRVWLGVHYPTDVLAGAILGGGAGVGMHALARSLIGDDDANGVGNIQMTIVRVGF